MIAQFKSHKSLFPLLSILVMGSILMLMATSCSLKTFSKTTQKIQRNLTASDGGLRKFVVFLPFSNPKILESNNNETIFYENLFDTFQINCPDILYQQLNEGKLFQALTTIPLLRSGQIDNFSLSQISKNVGLNAVITGSFIDISTHREKRGALWFKRDRYLLQAQIEVEVFDSLTATKALAETFIFEEEVDESIFKQVRSKQFNNLPKIQEVLQQIADNMGDEICSAMDDVYARGYVVAVKGNKIIVSSGRKAGIKPGQTLKAFKMGKIIQGISDHSFIIPGPKIGEIKTTRVYPDRSEAKIITGGPVPAGSSVSILD
jgi:hypothetical protein